jgi:hypothetical protein
MSSRPRTPPDTANRRHAQAGPCDERQVTGQDTDHSPAAPPAPQRSVTEHSARAAARRAKAEADAHDPNPATSTQPLPKRPARTHTEDSDPHEKATKAADRGEKADTAHPLAGKEPANTETPEPAAGRAGEEGGAGRRHGGQQDPAHRHAATAATDGGANRTRSGNGAGAMCANGRASRAQRGDEDDDSAAARATERQRADAQPTSSSSRGNRTAHRGTAGQQSAAQQATGGAGDTDRSDHAGHGRATDDQTASRQHSAPGRAGRHGAPSRRGENRAPTTGRGERDKSHGVPPREPERYNSYNNLQ